MLFDRSNEENLKYGLEKSYHKSIIEAHAQQSTDINIIGTLSLFYIEDVECNAANSASGEYEISNTVKFDQFSLIKPRLSKSSTPGGPLINEVSTNFLPIGRYFMRVKYRRVLFTGDTQLDVLLNSSSSVEKESIVDLSLLPLAIRAQLVYEFEASQRRGTQPKYQNVNALAIDSHLLQIEINKKRDELIKEAIIKSSSPLETEALLMSIAAAAASSSAAIRPANSSPQLDEFIKCLEVDLNSYYICEKLMAEAFEHELGREIDLVKLNKLDALASFKCVQKYRALLWNVIFAEKSRRNINRSANSLSGR